MVVPLLAMIGACTELFGPTDNDLAARCGVTVTQLNQNRERVKKLEPYDGRELGRCMVMRGDGRSDVMVVENWSELTRQ